MNHFPYNRVRYEMDEPRAEYYKRATEEALRNIDIFKALKSALIEFIKISSRDTFVEDKVSLSEILGTLEFDLDVQDGAVKNLLSLLAKAEDEEKTQTSS